MIEQTDHSKEWFQATITLGNFGSREEAMSAIRSLSHRKDFVSSKVEGSWSIEQAQQRFS